MKKMQCEVCGGTSIKKVSDSVFECQNCGIQYSSEEVKKLLVEITGGVTIDHTKEVENTIKRAKEFETQGELSRAKQYYDQALDLDADNKEAGERVKDLSKKQAYADYYVIEPNVDPQKNLRDFLEQLSLCDCIACDVYKEIEITDVKEVFYPFYFIKKSATIIWNAVSIKYYYEKETVYRDRYNSTTKRTEKVPETRDVRRAQRTPVNGTQDAYGSKLAIASDDLLNSCKSEDKTALTALIAEFAEQQNDKYDGKNANRIDLSKLNDTNGVITYMGYVLNGTLDNTKLNEAEEKVIEESKNRAWESIYNSIPGDEYEGLTSSVGNIKSSVAKILVPVQVIEYRYKGKIYTAVSDLLERTTTIPCTYPCDTELSEEKSGLLRERESANKLGCFFTGGIGVFIIGIISLMVAAGTNKDSWGFTALAMMIAGAVLAIIALVLHNKKNKAYIDRAATVKRDIYLPKKEALERTKKVFFDQYTDRASACGAASGEQCITVARVHTEVSSAKNPSEMSDYFDNINQFAGGKGVNDGENMEEIKILRFGEKVYKKARILYPILTLLICVATGFIGIFLSDFGDDWYSYIAGVLGLVIGVAGFIAAVIFPLIVFGTYKGKMLEAQSAILSYKKLSVGESPIQGFDKARIDKVIEKVKKKQEKQKKLDDLKKRSVFSFIGGWIKQNILVLIIPAAIIIAVSAAIVIELNTIAALSKPYEEELIERVFVCESRTNNFGNRSTSVIKFEKNGKYKEHYRLYSTKEGKYVTDEMNEGTYVIKKEVLGEKRIIIELNGYDEYVIQDVFDDYVIYSFKNDYDSAPMYIYDESYEFE